MIFELFEDTVEMSFIVFCPYAVFRAYVRLRQPAWSMLLERRRLAILSALVLAVLSLKVTEDVLGGESGPIDGAILDFVHAHVSTAWTAVFEAITLSGSTFAPFPAVSLATVALLYWKHRYEAFLLAASALTGAGLVYIVKTFVGRARPELWPSEWVPASQMTTHSLSLSLPLQPPPRSP